MIPGPQAGCRGCLNGALNPLREAIMVRDLAGEGRIRAPFRNPPKWGVAKW